MIRGIAATLAALAVSAVAAAAADHRAYTNRSSELVHAIDESDFDRLERAHDEWLESRERALDGTWMIQALQDAFESRFRVLPPARTDRFLELWKRERPQSRLRPIAEAFARLQRAWVAKGTGCHVQRPSSARKAFDAGIARAAAALAEGEADGVRSPLWHAAALLVAGAQSRPAADLDAILRDAARRFPGYVPLYAARMEFLTPDWGGDFDALDRFIRASAEENRQREGGALYAWLYLELASSHYCDRFFEQSRVQWRDMKAAFEDMVERHPDAWNRNLFATFACRARDVETTRRLLAELGPAASLGAWSRGISTEGCRRMVSPDGVGANDDAAGNPGAVAPVNPR